MSAIDNLTQKQTPKHFASVANPVLFCILYFLGLSMPVLLALTLRFLTIF